MIGPSARHGQMEDWHEYLAEVDTNWGKGVLYGMSRLMLTGETLATPVISDRHALQVHAAQTHESGWNSGAYRWED